MNLWRDKGIEHNEKDGLLQFNRNGNRNAQVGIRLVTDRSIAFPESQVNLPKSFHVGKDVFLNSPRNQ